MVALAFDIQPTERSEAVRVAREHAAEAVSMRAVLHPRSVAVVGASRGPDSSATDPATCWTGGFRGALHAVNREATRSSG